MAARKLQQEVDKCFKKVSEGVAEFEAIYDKIEQSNNPAQKEKLEDNLKREIKKLQRLRDQIKTWAASNDIKDKAPLLENRKLIETQMERFKAVEKAMKTKAYSKEGLSAAAKLDPKEQAKADASDFLSQMVDELEQQIESLEAECESIQATKKKGKNHTLMIEKVNELEAMIDKHKWHQGRMELIRRSLENGRLDVRQVRELEEDIRYYVSDNMNEDYVEDEGMYVDLNLDEEEDAYGMNLDKDNVSSQDTQSIQDDMLESENLVLKGKSRAGGAAVGAAIGAAVGGGAVVDISSTRRPSAQLKSPLPTLATLQPPLATTTSNVGAIGSSSMKAAPIPARPAEGLKYASAAAAAAASDKIGISPLPPPPGGNPVSTLVNSPLPSVAAVQARSSTANSPVPLPAQPAAIAAAAAASPVPISSTAVPTTSQLKLSIGPSAGQLSSKSRGKAPAPPEAVEQPSRRKYISREEVIARPQTPTNPRREASKANGVSNGFTTIKERTEEEECIYHLPSSLRDIVDSYESNMKRQVSPLSQASLRMLARSQDTIPEPSDLEPRSTYQPEVRYTASSNYPTEPLAVFDDPLLYRRIDPDTLFYVFYYKQGTYQQYRAAKALKDQSWRFHKQYQTWFQRHEEPKAITEEFEQGTYRFFDYESTWMNRRKADFKFHYKYLEDDV